MSLNILQYILLIFKMSINILPQFFGKSIRPKILFLVLLVLVGVFSFSSLHKALADESEDLWLEIIKKKGEQYTLTNRLNEIKEYQNSLQSRLSSLQGQLNVTDEQISSLNTNLGNLDEELSLLEEELEKRQLSLSNQESTRSFAMRRLYKTPFTGLWLLSLMRSEGFSVINYQKALLARIFQTITNINGEIILFKKDQQDLKNMQASLLVQKSQLSNLRSQISGQASQIQAQLEAALSESSALGSRLSSLSQEINAAMVRHQQLAYQSKGTCSGRAATPNPVGAPSWYFWGRGTEHGVGMSQYGAYGMAKSGKSAQDILTFYYTGAQVSTWSSPSRIVVNKDGANYDLLFEEEYLAGIGEVPNNWPEEVIKAQIIAARSYAWSYAQNYPNSVICATESCQVYVGGQGKRSHVDQTRGQVVTYGGNIVQTYYFSTSGGHTDNVGDSPSFTFDKSSRSFPQALRESKNNNFPYLRRVDDSQYDSYSPYHSWSGNLTCSDSQSNPPSGDYRGGNPISQPDMTLILNASMLKDGGYLDSLEYSTPEETIISWLQAEGTTPIQTVSQVELIKMGNSSDRVMWVKANGSNRSINEGEITGTRFRYVYNLLSPERDWLYSTWFEVGN